jgi:AcrR family transcriptional regulator
MEDGFDRFSVQRVLDGAEVSRATLYRHFPDVDGLIESALVETFRQELDRVLDQAKDIMERSTDVASLRSELQHFFTVFSKIPDVLRLRRAHTFVLASTRPGLATTVAVMQEALTDNWESALLEGQRKGLIRTDLDVRAAAVMIQAMAIGRIVDDTAVNHISNERWANIFLEFVDRAILTPPN